jgi:putative transposase
MAFKLLQAAQDGWRAVNGPHLVALVRAGATFHKGQLVEHPTDLTKKDPQDSTEEGTEHGSRERRRVIM